MSAVRARQQKTDWSQRETSSEPFLVDLIKLGSLTYLVIYLNIHLYYFSMNDSKKIELFNKKEPLLIYGNPGSGKTYLALELLKNTILLRIDTGSLKGIKDINEYITNTLKKRSITLMFNEKNEQRSLLIDDIHVHYKYDKPTYKSIINFFKDKIYYGSKIIITCNNSFLKNKDLVRLKMNRIEIKYNYSSYYKICLRIIKDKKVKLSSDDKDIIIYKSRFNFHKLISELNMKKKDNDNKIILIDNKDNFDGIEECTNNLLMNKYSLEEIYRLFDSDEIIIGLNILENCYHFINPRFNIIALSKIYSDYSYSDIMETYMISNHIWELRNYNISLTIFTINYMINKYSNKSNIKPIYNRYISKSLANVSSLKFYNINYFPFSDTIYYLLYTWSITKNSKYQCLLCYIYNKYPRFFLKYTKGFTLFYDIKIDLNIFKNFLLEDKVVILSYQS